MELILHHYDPSPYSEKVRLMFGLEALTWRSVIVPMVLPVIGFIAWLIAGPRGR
jgi:glutathione S-transferase